MDISLKSGIFYAIISGILLGLASFFAKIALSAGFLQMFFNPMLWVAGFLGIAGFLAMQKSFHSEFLSLTISIIAGLSIALPVLLASIFLNEAIGSDIVGMLLILAGVFLLGFSSKKP